MKELLYMTNEAFASKMGSFQQIPLEGNFTVVHTFPADTTKEQIWLTAQNISGKGWHPPLRSMMVGDMIRDTETGEIWRCASVGWELYRKEDVDSHSGN